MPEAHISPSLFSSQTARKFKFTYHFNGALCDIYSTYNLQNNTKKKLIYERQRVKETIAIVLPREYSQFSGISGIRSSKYICSVALVPTALKFKMCLFPDMVLHEIFSTLHLKNNNRLSVRGELN